ncbi:hypothetical protein M409DRAFT_65638 [Zasmidium cellare ATCC 36951]|uniref:Major facilitator superfamily (MFS) profile domain-containing protein n=1 Tax=Zasmidium cellare ATCC 36951 TaxID=1080233 RepID=A0A6A6CNA7_ZASCE|nr:uncharacterized protein M409DRAFT_65638 [Zasmidium cellare ATCC 36951]KAF2168123.1 hypothetical protein M409DRAFT_65638 [Zasmidium cellare ATCC 36951]
MAEALPVPLPVEVEKQKIQSSLHSDSSPQLEYDPEIEKRVIRKCDLRVVPPTLVLFALSFLDRVNIGNARIQGLTKDLNMVGTDYNVALLILFVPFILFEIPSNLIMKKMKPSTWLSVLLFGCGIMNMCMGFVRTYGELVGVRFLLGLFEAGTGPGSIYLIAMYYRRYELPWRISWWYTSGIVAGAFGGLLAYAIAHMDGLQGYSGWRWIFIIEGAVTAAVGILMKFWLVDWPEDATFLTPEEKAVMLARLSRDRAEEARMDRWNTKRVFKDWKVYVGTLMFFGIVNTNYSTNFFIPTILVEMGYKAVEAQVYTIPIYAVAAVFCLSLCYLSDRLKHRFAFILFGVLLGFIGYVILLTQQGLPVGAKYFALFTLVTCGYIVQPISVSWLMNNVGGHYKRAFASAAQIGWGNAGGIVASNIYITSEAPFYKTGYGVSIALLLFTGVMSGVMFWGLVLENRKRARGERDYRLQGEDADNLGDDDPRFKFAY